MKQNETGVRVLRQDAGLGLIVAAFGAWALYKTFSMPASAVLFPRIVTSLLIILSLLLTVTSLINMKKGKYPDAQPLEVKTLQNPLISFAMIVAYVALINVLGFYSATVLFLIVFMRYMNIRSIKTIALTEVVLVGFIYLLFSVALNVRLPQGLLM